MAPVATGGRATGRLWLCAAMPAFARNTRPVQTLLTIGASIVSSGAAGKAVRIGLSRADDPPFLVSILGAAELRSLRIPGLLVGRALRSVQGDVALEPAGFSRTQPK